MAAVNPRLIGADKDRARQLAVQQKKRRERGLRVKPSHLKVLSPTARATLARKRRMAPMRNQIVHYREAHALSGAIVSEPVLKEPMEQHVSKKLHQFSREFKSSTSRDSGRRAVIQPLLPVGRFVAAYRRTGSLPDVPHGQSVRDFIDALNVASKDVTNIDMKSFARLRRALLVRAGIEENPGWSGSAIQFNATYAGYSDVLDLSLSLDPVLAVFSVVALLLPVIGRPIGFYLSMFSVAGMISIMDVYSGVLASFDVRWFAMVVCFLASLPRSRLVFNVVSLLIFFSYGTVLPFPFLIHVFAHEWSYVVSPLFIMAVYRKDAHVLTYLRLFVRQAGTAVQLFWLRYPPQAVFTWEYFDLFKENIRSIVSDLVSWLVFYGRPYYNRLSQPLFFENWPPVAFLCRALLAWFSGPLARVARVFSIGSALLAKVFDHAAGWHGNTLPGRILCPVVPLLPVPPSCMVQSVLRPVEVVSFTTGLKIHRVDYRCMRCGNRVSTGPDGFVHSPMHRFGDLPDSQFLLVAMSKSLVQYMPRSDALKYGVYGGAVEYSTEQDDASFSVADEKKPLETPDVASCSLPDPCSSPVPPELPPLPQSTSVLGNVRAPVADAVLMSRARTAAEGGVVPLNRPRSAHLISGSPPTMPQMIEYLCLTCADSPVPALRLYLRLFSPLPWLAWLGYLAVDFTHSESYVNCNGDNRLVSARGIRALSGQLALMRVTYRPRLRRSFHFAVFPVIIILGFMFDVMFFAILACMAAFLTFEPYCGSREFTYCPALTDSLQMEFSRSTNRYTALCNIRSHSMRFGALPIPADLAVAVIRASEAMAIANMECAGFSSDHGLAGP